MNKKFVLRFLILASFICIMSLLLLVSANFSSSAIINVLGTLAMIILLAIVISWSIIRKSSSKLH